MVDFEVDGTPPEPSDEKAAKYYAGISGGLFQDALGTGVGETTISTANAMERGTKPGASVFDRAIGWANVPVPGAEYDDPSGYLDEVRNPKPVELLQPEDYNKRFGPVRGDGTQVPIGDQPMPEELARTIGQQRQQQMDKEAAWGRFQGNHNWLTNLGVGLVRFGLDPINASSAIIPGVGEEAFLAGVSRVGLDAGTIAARSAARLGAGATAGAAQQSVVGTATAALDTEEGADFDLRNVLKDVAFGAAFGAAVHGGVMGGLREAGIIRPDAIMSAHGNVEITPGPDAESGLGSAGAKALAAATLEQREAAINVSTSQIMDGRPVDVTPIIPTPDEPPMTMADLAQSQARIERNGYAPGIPQAEFDGVNERIYSPKGPEAAAPKPEEPKITVDESGVEHDPEMDALEARVRSSPHLTGGDHAVLDEASNGVIAAVAKGNAYTIAGEMLRDGERIPALLPMAAKQTASLLPRAAEDLPLSRSITDPATGETLQAIAQHPLSDVLKAADVSEDPAASSLERANSMAISDVVRRHAGDVPVFVMKDDEIGRITPIRFGDAPPAGFFDPNANRIVISASQVADPSYASHLILHEGLHAAFARTIESSTAAREVIDHLRELASSAHEGNGGAAADIYGLASPHEFVSEAFSNPDFQRFLAGIEAPDYLVRSLGLEGRGTIRTMWDAFVAAVRQIMGMRGDQQSLLDATMRIGQWLDENATQTGRSEFPSSLPAPRQPGGDISRIERAVAERGGLGPGEARTLIREVSDRAEQMRATGQADPYVAAARELADKIKDNARKDKLDALRNAATRSNILARIDEAGGMAAAPEQLRSMLHGTYASGLDSVQSQSRGLASTWQATLSRKLHSLGLEKAAISGSMDTDIAKELWAMNAGEKAEPGNKLARQVAEAIKPVLDEIKDRFNAAGARIGDATDYVSRTRHDPYKMRRAAGSGRNTPDEAFAAWWKETQPLLADKTFDGVTPRDGETLQQARDRFGRSVYDALLSGVHMTADGASGIAFDPEGGARSGPAFEGTRNLAKKASQDRTLFWRDGEAWNSYMQRYGAQTSLTQGVMLTIAQAAKQIPLMERFGTNPMANLNMIERAITERGRGDFEGLQKFQSRMTGVKNVMGYLDGSANIPVNADWARIGNNIRTYYSMADLGGVGITHFASIWPTISSEMRHHGMGRWETLRNMVGALVQGRGSEERQAILSDLGAYSDGLARDMHANWQPDSPQMGRMSSMANTFMKYTGIHWVFDNSQAGVRSMLSHNLARNMGKEFGELEPHLQQMLDSYGIKQRDWDLLRNVDGLKTEGGRAYLTPRDAMRVSPDAVEQHLREIGELGPEQEPADTAGMNEPPMNPAEDATFKYARGLADKLQSYYSDVAAHSTVTAGARERAMVFGNTPAGSLSGEFWRFVSQFKMWPIAAMDQLVRREIQMSTSKADMAWGLGSMAALSAASGYFRMTANDFLLGKPRRELDAKTMLAALAQGGGLGIMGDFMFGEVNRMGGGFVGTLGGPAISDVDELVKLFGRFRMDLTDPQSHHKNGEFADLWPDLAHFAVRHVPFANLAYVKGALDYGLWYHLFEAASPGWWERTNRRMIKEQGRGFQGYQPGGGVPYGVPYLYMQNHGGQTFGALGKN